MTFWGQRVTDMKNWAKLSENNTFETGGGQTHRYTTSLYICIRIYMYKKILSDQNGISEECKEFNEIVWYELFMTANSRGVISEYTFFIISQPVSLKTLLKLLLSMKLTNSELNHFLLVTHMILKSEKSTDDSER